MVRVGSCLLGLLSSVAFKGALAPTHLNKRSGLRSEIARAPVRTSNNSAAVQPLDTQTKTHRQEPGPHDQRGGRANQAIGEVAVVRPLGVDDGRGHVSQ